MFGWWFNAGNAGNGVIFEWVCVGLCRCGGLIFVNPRAPNASVVSFHGSLETGRCWKPQGAYEDTKGRASRSGKWLDSRWSISNRFETDHGEILVHGDHQSEKSIEIMECTSPFQFPAQNGRSCARYKRCFLKKRQPPKWGWALHYVETGRELHFKRFQCLGGWNTYENRKLFCSKGSCPLESSCMLDMRKQRKNPILSNRHLL